MVRFLFVASACCLVLACSGGASDKDSSAAATSAAPAASATDHNGTWAGKTSQDRPIEFVVRGGAISSLKLGVRLKLDTVCARPGAPVGTDYRGGEADVAFSTPMPISSGKFSLTAGVSDVDARGQGQFSAAGATGTIDLQATPASGCSGKDSVTWSAARVDEK